MERNKIVFEAQYECRVHTHTQSLYTVSPQCYWVNQRLVFGTIELIAAGSCFFHSPGLAICATTVLCSFPPSSFLLFEWLHNRHEQMTAWRRRRVYQ